MKIPRARQVSGRGGDTPGLNGEACYLADLLEWESLHADDCLTPNFVLPELNDRGKDISIGLPFLYSRRTPLMSPSQFHLRPIHGTMVSSGFPTVW